MLAATLALGSLGLLLFFGSPVLARRVVRRRLGIMADPVGTVLVLRGIGVVLMLAALLFRPRDPDTAAFPPHPDSPARAEARHVPGGSAREAALGTLDHPASSGRTGHE